MIPVARKASPRNLRGGAHVTTGNIRKSPSSSKIRRPSSGVEKTSRTGSVARTKPVDLGYDERMIQPSRPNPRPISEPVQVTEVEDSVTLKAGTAGQIELEHDELRTMLQEFIERGDGSIRIIKIPMKSAASLTNLIERPGENGGDAEGSQQRAENVVVIRGCSNICETSVPRMNPAPRSIRCLIATNVLITLMVAVILSLYIIVHYDRLIRIYYGEIGNDDTDET